MDSQLIPRVEVARGGWPIVMSDGQGRLIKDRSPWGCICPFPSLNPVVRTGSSPCNFNSGNELAVHLSSSSSCLYAAPGRAVLDQPTLPIGHDDRPGGLDIRWTCDGAYKSSHDISCSRPYVPYVHELEVRDGHVKTDEHIQDLSSQLKGHFASLAPPDKPWSCWC
jgi:hypothetical protein